MTNQPIIKLKDYPYEIALWKKVNEHGAFYDGNITYSYKDKSGSYQNIKLPIDGPHLSRVAGLLQAAYAERVKMITADRSGEQEAA